MLTISISDSRVASGVAHIHLENPETVLGHLMWLAKSKGPNAFPEAAWRWIESNLDYGDQEVKTVGILRHDSAVIQVLICCILWIAENKA